MKVDFNNLRRLTLFSYEGLVKKLNEKIYPNGVIEMDARDIQEEMDNLRQFIGSIAMTYEPDDENFKNVFEEQYPSPKRMSEFNPNEL